MNRRPVKLRVLCAGCCRQHHVAARDTQLVHLPDETAVLWWSCPARCGWQHVTVTQGEAIGIIIGGTHVLDWSDITLDDPPPMMSPEQFDAWHTIADLHPHAVQGIMVAAAYRVLDEQ